MDFLTNIDGYEPFVAAILLLAAIFLLQFTLFCIGLDALSFLDDLMPDIGDVDGPEVAGIDKALSFVGFGRVPSLVVVILFLAAFGSFGVVMQMVLTDHLAPLSPWLATLISLPVGIFATRYLSKGVARILPSDETSAVSSESLIGRVAYITYGDATSTGSAAARTTDHLGNTHDIYVKASSSEELFQKGDEILLVSKIEGFYLGTSNNKTIN